MRDLARLVIASHNEGKVAEIAALLAPLGIKAEGARALALPEPEETGETFAENAALKAEAAMRATALPALSDDSGLCVDALGGAPGVRSARWAGEARDFAGAMARLERELAACGAIPGPPPAARFVCALALSRPGQGTRIFEGRAEGRLVFPPRGSLGFGYDPVFLPEGESLTFAQMDPARKHAISHRARAFARLLADLVRD